LRTVIGQLAMTATPTPAAVDVDDCAVDELGFVGGEVYRCVCDRVRRAERRVQGAVHQGGGGVVLDRGAHDTGGRSR
jgi:hypothetical protein